jgi:predicted PurR-regulated permease PerM
MPPRRTGRYPNVFYLALLVVSTAFVVTALAYLVAPSIAQKASEDPRLARENPATPRLAAWLDSNGPASLSIQFGLMVVLGLAAMATDQWFEGGTERPDGDGPG